ncbi:probable protein phosphatase 2C 12 [Magnolia sinica]|uniref:probable protein phosphatase 2C 12 n=1 Tax=Magnolia sinica TaxID=86752 RepID=UPI002658D024|nr:probable protein phosphatase 2C 12 [Magnolia sinica]
MGICISSASLENQEIVIEGYENVVFVDKRLCSNGIPKLASIHSQQGKKGPNQDSAIICQGYGMEGGVFCGVFDGHGRNGHIVSRLVRDRLPWLVLNQRNAIASLNHITNDDYGDVNESLDGDLVSSKIFDGWKEACHSAFKAMDKELKLHEKLDSTCSGTTAVAIIKQDEDLIIANLGDSRAILGTMSDESALIAVPLTTDLKPSLPEEAERITKANGRIFALREEPSVQRVWLPDDDFPGLAMARAFGDFRLKNYGIIATPQITHHRISSNDQFLVLATDGVWDVLSNIQVASIVWSAKSEEAAARMVVDAAVLAWQHKFPSSRVDDCSAVCLFLQERRQQQ